MRQASRSNACSESNRSLEKGPASFDQRMRLVGNATYELPFGAGKPFLNKGGAWNYVFGGYEIVVLQQFGSGNPMSFSFANSPNNYYATSIGSRVPNLVPGVDPQIVSGYRDLGGNRFNQALSNAAININAFAYPAAFTIGNLGRGVVTGPGLLDTNVKFKKAFKITERISAEVHYDITNAFHNYGFRPPSSSVDFKNPQLFGKITADNGTVAAAPQPTQMLTLKLRF